jgi:hypothetical protein
MHVVKKGGETHLAYADESWLRRVIDAVPEANPWSWRPYETTLRVYWERGPTSAPRSSFSSRFPGGIYIGVITPWQLRTRRAA